MTKNTRYEITSSHTVCGHHPGDTVTADDLHNADIDHLVKSGHLRPSKQAKPTTTDLNHEAESTKED